jgi:hypothetical protein
VSNECERKKFLMSMVMDHNREGEEEGMERVTLTDTVRTLYQHRPRTKN